MRDLGVLNAVARALVAPGKGILAADESTSTIKKRFDAVHVESTPETHRAYRDMLFTTPGMEAFISGVILFDETIRQASYSGSAFPRLLKEHGVIPGIKVDEGAKDMAGFPGEKITEGLDSLRGRLKEYRDLGAEFAKWRAVITIGDGIPSRTCIEANAEALARYAALCQEADIVPIVEPEVLMDGAHSLQRCEDVTIQTLELVFDRLFAHDVLLEGMLLKPNMVIPGNQSGENASPEMIAEATLRTFKRAVPAAVPGIVFLSGGQSPEEATLNLNAMNQHKDLPWKLSFSYGRALQDAPMHAWAGRQENVDQGKKVFYHRAQCNSAAQLGQYTPEMETARA